MNDREVLEALYATVENRRDNPKEGSYTCYLLDKGIDKILKKVGEECSETIIAVTDYILALGKRQDMEENDYDIEKCELFYVPKGTVVELYATTLHYTPITVKDSFETICLLLRGTGDSCQRRGILKKKNKWFIAHKDNVEKVQAGDYPGLKGKMIHIKHL